MLFTTNTRFDFESSIQGHYVNQCPTSTVAINCLKLVSCVDRDGIFASQGYRWGYGVVSDLHIKTYCLYSLEPHLVGVTKYRQNMISNAQTSTYVWYMRMVCASVGILWFWETAPFTANAVWKFTEQLLRQTRNLSRLQNGQHWWSAALQCKISFEHAQISFTLRFQLVSSKWQRLGSNLGIAAHGSGLWLRVADQSQAVNPNDARYLVHK